MEGHEYPPTDRSRGPRKIPPSLPKPHGERPGPRRQARRHSGRCRSAAKSAMSRASVTDPHRRIDWRYSNPPVLDGEHDTVVIAPGPSTAAVGPARHHRPRPTRCEVHTASPAHYHRPQTHDPPRSQARANSRLRRQSHQPDIFHMTCQSISRLVRPIDVEGYPARAEVAAMGTATGRNGTRRRV